jgi:hypothetical protein
METPETIFRYHPVPLSRQRDWVVTGNCLRRFYDKTDIVARRLAPATTPSVMSELLNNPRPPIREMQSGDSWFGEDGCRAFLEALEFTVKNDSASRLNRLSRLVPIVVPNVGHYRQGHNLVGMMMFDDKRYIWICFRLSDFLGSVAGAFERCRQIGH